MLTPASVHYGHAAEILVQRGKTLDAAYAAHPERFVRKLYWFSLTLSFDELGLAG